jgi:hypothetical protein
MKYLIIHHSVTGHNVSVETILSWGYTEVIKWNGAYHFVGGTAHTKGHNSDGIGICLVGNFMEENPSSEQIAQLKARISYYQAKYPGIQVVGHRDLRDNPYAGYNHTSCPGDNLHKLIPELIKGEPMKKWTEAIKFEGDELYGYLTPEDWAGGNIIQMIKPEIIKFKSDDRAYIWIDSPAAASKMVTGLWTNKITELDVVPRSDLEGLEGKLTTIANELGVNNDLAAIIMAIVELKKSPEEPEPEPTPPTPPIINGWLKTALTYISNFFKNIFHIK